MTIKERNTSLDILRLFAFFCVVSIHFFLNAGFYNVPVEGTGMFVLMVIRSFFMICVPLFIIMSGMLMYKKKFEGRYYRGIVKTYVGYIIASIACLIYWVHFEKIEYTLRDTVLGILNFNIASYSWYVEMYIGLFLIIPFLNLAYNHVGSRKRKLALVVIFVLLTALPASVNSFNFEVVGWWQKPGVAYISNKIIPEWWLFMYPIGFYFVGCYLGEYKPKLGRIKNLLYIALLTVAFAAFCYWRNFGGLFIWGGWQDHRALPVVILSVLVIIFIMGINASRLPRVLRSVLAYASDCTLLAFLVSCIFDKWFYRILNENTLYMEDKIVWFPVIVSAVFVSSLLLAGVLNLINKPVSAAILRVIDLICGAFSKKEKEDQKSVESEPSSDTMTEKAVSDIAVSPDSSVSSETEESAEKILR